MFYGFNDDKSKQEIISKELYLEVIENPPYARGLMFSKNDATNRFAAINIDILRSFLLKNKVPSFTSNDNDKDINVILTLLMSASSNNSKSRQLTCVRCRAPFEWYSGGTTTATKGIFSTSSDYMDFEVIEANLTSSKHDHYIGEIITINDESSNSLVFAAYNKFFSNRPNKWSVDEYSNTFTQNFVVNSCFCQVAKLEIMNNYQ